ncbi:MAG: CRTAC1 family protein [Chloroflexi bacterium]|nr:CRTAC1 family protein [Chloroflexota bacterium]
MHWYGRAVVIVVSVGISAGIVALLYFAYRPSSEQFANVNSSTHPVGYTADLQEYCDILTPSDNPHIGQSRLRTLIDLAVAEPDANVVWRIDYALRMAHERLKFGDADEAVRLLENALALEEERGVNQERLDEILDALIVAYIRQGENDNCITPEGRYACILPLNGPSHQKPNGSQGAIRYLTRVLTTHPDDMRYRWLLNITHMTLGTYPDDVPEQFLISPTKFGSDVDIGRFEEIAPEAGIYNIKLAGGSIVDDFDNEGLPDIITTTWDPCGSMAYYHNDGDGRFSDLTASSGLEKQLGGLNLIQADYNNDGWLDVLVLRGGWMLEDGQMRMSLLRNNGDNTFTDLTHVAGLASEHPRQGAAWADYNLDGHLDLYVCNESEPISWLGDPETGGYPTIHASELFRNNGDGTFTEMANIARVTNDRYCKGTAWGDYDNDGDPDLYVSNFGESNRLYRNDGGGTFLDIAHAVGVAEPINSFATWFWDYNNDGCLDLFVAGYSFDIAEVAKDYLGLPNEGSLPKLYKNDCTGGFADVTEEAGLNRVHLTMGANYGDFDNDGFQDVLLGTGFVDYDSLEPNAAYRNDNSGKFQDVTLSSGFGHLQKGHAVAFGDIDRDGDQDVFMQIGGFFPGDAFLSALYENPGHGNHWLSIKLVGTKSNRDAMGARIKITVRSDEGERAVFAFVSSGGSFGASTLEQEVGLGDAIEVISVEIRWPSGTAQSIEEISLDTHIRVTEGMSGFELLKKSSIRLAPDRTALDFY